MAAFNLDAATLIIGRRAEKRAAEKEREQLEAESNSGNSSEFGDYFDRHSE